MGRTRSFRGRARVAATLVSLILMVLPVASAAEDALGRDTPRGTMTGFLVATREGEFERGAQYLELRGLDPATARLGGAELARRLKMVLDQGLWVDLDALSDEPDGNREDGWEDRDLVGVVQLEEISFDAFLRRGPGEEALWQVAAGTVVQAASVYDGLGIRRIERYLPEIFFEIRVLEILLWQWIALLVLVIAAWMLSWVFSFLVSRIVRPLVSRTRTDLDDEFFEIAMPPLRLAAGMIVMTVAVRSLGLAVPAMELIGTVLRVMALLAVVWFLSRLVDLLARIVEQKLTDRGDPGVKSLVTPGKRTVKVVIGVIALVAVLDNFGFDVAALIAGLGVGGIAIALAAQKTLENLFGGITLYADQPVRVGDFCRYGDKVGIVEDIGLRSTRVRSLDRTVVSIPNASFSSMQLENFAKRDRIRLITQIGVLYDTTPDALRYILVEIRRMLYAHEKVLPDPCRVRLVSFGAYSIDLEIFAYVATTDWNEFLGIREDLFLRIMDIVEASGSSFAFPSQTVYLGRDGGVDRKRMHGAEKEVAAWRESEEMYLPDFPPEKIAELDDTIRFPAEGAPARG
jgi:MscS family membrane protein